MPTSLYSQRRRKRSYLHGWAQVLVTVLFATGRSFPLTQFTRFQSVLWSSDEMDMTRRLVFETFSSASLLALDSPTTRTSTTPPVTLLSSSRETIVVPLQYIPQLSAYVAYYSVGGDRFGAIVDTGSPFLTVPSYCNEQKWGCYRPSSSLPSGLADTVERFDNNQGRVEWRRAPFSFLGAGGSLMGPEEICFGVLDEDLMGGPGGVFMGLIRDTDNRIRPSFLGQTNIRGFCVDLIDKTLTLSTDTLIPDSSDFIPLVRDLKLRFGDPVLHYTARANNILVNGRPLGNDKKPIYVIFDTGVTGMVVSSELLNERYSTARQNRERTLWGTVELAFTSGQGKGIALTAQKPVTTPLGERPWPKFKNAHLIVAGLAFLDGRKTTVDVTRQRLQLV